MEVDQQPAVDDDDHLKDSRDEGPEQGDDGAVGFDAADFAAILRKPMISCNYTWDPLTRALETLAAAMAKQQKGNNSAMEEMRDQLTALQSRMEKSESEKQDLTESVSNLQDVVGNLKTELDKVRDQQVTQQSELDRLREELSSNAISSATGQTPAPSSDSEATAPLATTDDLKNVKRDLTNQLKKSFSAVFGEQFVVSDEEGEAGAGADSMPEPSLSPVREQDAAVASDEGASTTEDETSSSGIRETETSSRPTTASSESAGVLRTPLPGVPFASEAMVKAEIANLRELQAALEKKLAGQTQSIDEMTDKLASLDTTTSDIVARQIREDRRKSSPRDLSIGPSNDVLQKQIQDIQEQQSAQGEQLKDHRQIVDKHTAEIKELHASLDDLVIQQQTAASMFKTAPSDASDHKKPGDAPPPQLDLSLVFTKIADLRRTTDASLDQLQRNFKDAIDGNRSQQAQLDALRNGLLFNEQQHLRLLDAQLAMQKELIERNQTHQDRTKPLLAEWKRAMEGTEDKLRQGLCDQDIMDEMQQLQRNYHRTILTMAPLINSPLTIAESLQTLSEEIKILEAGVDAGVIPLRLETSAGSGSESTGSSEGTPAAGGNDIANKHQRTEDFTTKLRYLDEEVAATQQVNVFTEKKNDPLIKSLEGMREKLELMWSLWHQNFAQKKGGGGHGNGVSDPPRPSEPSVNGAMAESMRDVELRLMGAIRRISTLEDDVERLNANAGSGVVQPRPSNRAEATNEEVQRLRKDMHDEISRLTSTLQNLQTTSLNRSPQPPSRLQTRSPDHDAAADLHNQMKRRIELDGRFSDGLDDHNQLSPAVYDNLLKDVTKKVTQAVMSQAEKNGLRLNGGPAGVGANPNVNYRAMLENFTQKVEDRLEDAREFTLEELARLRKELADLIKSRIDAALKELRAELMIYYPTDTGDSTAMGTKPVMCVACSRPVPVSGVVRDVGSYPPAEAIAEQANALIHAELEYDRSDDDFVFRGGFKMPAERKTMTLPFLATNIRNRIALNKIERQPRRPARHHGNHVDNVVREAMELDRKQRYRNEPSPPK